MSPVSLMGHLFVSVVWMSALVLQKHFGFTKALVFFEIKKKSICNILISVIV